MKLSLAKVDVLIWLLIYGGLLLVAVGLALRRVGAAARLIPLAGIVVVAAGVVLIWVRSRMAARARAALKAAPATLSSSRPPESTS